MTVFASCFLLACGAGQPEESGEVLAALDTTNVAESEDNYVGRAADIIADAEGTLYVSDVASRRVVRIARNGTIAGFLGRPGQGPGEFASPGFLSISGDTLLAVSDRGNARALLFDLRTSSHAGIVALPANSGRIRFQAGHLHIASFELDSATSVLRVAPDGTMRREGAIPEIARQYPMLAGPFGTQALLVADSRTYSIGELSPFLFWWNEGDRAMDSVEIPVRLRRGVRIADYETMVREPANAATLAYAHSIPMLLEQSAGGLLVLDMYDVEQAGQTFTGRHYLSLIDMSGKRACVDIPVPGPEDPPTRLALHADTLVSLEQDVSEDGKPVTRIRRFVIRPDTCRWEPLDVPGDKRQEM